MGEIYIEVTNFCALCMNQNNWIMKERRRFCVFNEKYVCGAVFLRPNIHKFSITVKWFPQRWQQQQQQQLDHTTKHFRISWTYWFYWSQVFQFFLAQFIVYMLSSQKSVYGLVKKRFTWDDNWMRLTLRKSSLLRKIFEELSLSERICTIEMDVCLEKHEIR